MSGDVFGNGMLLSEHIRLVAGLRPRTSSSTRRPDAATSFAERRRLFELPRRRGPTTTIKISAGGGVYPRTAKSIRSPRRSARRSASTSLLPGRHPG
jgi:glutamate dehydrogenase